MPWWCLGIKVYLDLFVLADFLRIWSQGIHHHEKNTRLGWNLFTFLSQVSNKHI